MNRKCKNPQKNDQAKPNANFEIQCELGSNTYRLALKREKKNLPLSPVRQSLVSKRILYFIQKKNHPSQLLKQHNQSAVYPAALKIILQHGIM